MRFDKQSLFNKRMVLFFANGKIQALNRMTPSNKRSSDCGNTSDKAYNTEAASSQLHVAGHVLFAYVNKRSSASKAQFTRSAIVAIFGLRQQIFDVTSANRATDAACGRVDIGSTLPHLPLRVGP